MALAELVESDFKANRYDPCGSRDFDWDEICFGKKGEVGRLIDSKAPREATNYTFVSDNIEGEPLIWYDHGSSQGVLRRCMVQYWARQ